MSVTDGDRAEALALALRMAPGTDRVDAIAQAFADERDRERSQWNPMIGRVLAVAQEWHRNGDSHGQQIFDAIEGNAK